MSITVEVKDFYTLESMLYDFECVTRGKSAGFCSKLPTF